MFSLPLELDPNTVGAVLEPVLGPHNRELWRLLTYSPELRRYLEYGVDPSFPKLKTGQAFWLLQSAPRSIDLNLIGLRHPQNQEMTIPLTRGYNQFGTVFFFPVALDDFMFERNGQRVNVVEAARRNWISNQLTYLDESTGTYRYDVAGFGAITPIEPWKGYWIYAKTNVTMIIPPIWHVPTKSSPSKPMIAGAMTLSTLQKSGQGSLAAYLTARGDLLDSWGNPVDSAGFNWDIARSLVKWQEGYLALDGFGGLHPLAGAAPVNSPVQFEFDVAKRITRLGDALYMLDGFGGVHPVEGAPEVPQAVRFESDLARDLEMIELENLDLDPYEAAIERLMPVPPPPGQSSIHGRLAYYVLDAFGRVHPVGGAVQRGYPELDEPVAVDMALTPNGDGYYVVDVYGNVFGFGNALVYEGQTPVFDHARIVRILTVQGGYLLLDSFGAVYPAGQAQFDAQPPAAGFDLIRDLVLE